MQDKGSTQDRSHEGGNAAHIEADPLAEVRAHSPEPADGQSSQEGAGRGETPLLGAVGWSRFGPAEELLIGGADPDARDGKGRTALHLMLKKGSAAEHFAMFVRAGARGDIPDDKGQTTAAILGRKRDPAWWEIAEGLATG